MRVNTKFLIIFVLAVSFLLAAALTARHRFSAQRSLGNQTARIHPEPVGSSEPRPTGTNAIPSAAREGFYVGKGNQRVYFDYATPDPLLRSFLQSVMDGSSNPGAQGKEIFLKICAVCHQPDGGGKDGLAPPLAGSDWVLTTDSSRLVRIVLNGLTGPIRVNGKDWNLAMPPWRENLDDY